MKKALQHLPTKLFLVVMLLLVLSSASLFLTTRAAHAQPLTTSLTIPKIDVEDSNWVPQKYFQAGSEVRFVLYVHNPSNFPDYVTMRPQVLYGNGAVLFNLGQSSTVISGNSTPGIYWGIVLPQSVPSGMYLFRAYVSDSQGTVEGYAVWTVSHSANAITWAKARLGSQSWNGLCELFVENAWNTSGRYGTAQAAFNAIHTSTNWSPDVGALVFFAPNSGNKWSGHVGIYLGGGQFISATNGGVAIYTLSYWNTYVASYEGWGNAPISWPGR